jgi:GH25 family lysozyme M1 (1,4-beta-N-acetylmuramidase)
MHRTRSTWLPLAAAALAVLVVLPGFAQTTDAATSKWTARCSANIRAWPKTSATIKRVVLKGAIVTATATVTGGWWSTSCAGGSHGYSWLKIVAINGKSTTSLFGKSAVYAAKGLFAYGPNPTPTPTPTPTTAPLATGAPTAAPTAAPTVAPPTTYVSNCSVRLRATASTTADTASIIDVNTAVTAPTTVNGGAWAADCPSAVSGSKWLRITAVGGVSTQALYGVAAVFAASGLFRLVQSSTYREGVDVSHWQGTIDWTKVRAAGKSFAIAKATEGVGFKDDHYDRNKAGAMGQGMMFGAYHFARPGLNTAIAEADYFVDNAAIEHGMLIPTLDLERDGGLTPSALSAWVKAWLGRVYERLGVRPMIYTSPSFWRTYMSDTRWFADNGYAILWVANWGVTSPSVPATNWGGRSWTFWQYTSDGTVPGITGRVDLNRYRFATFAAVTY